MWVPVLSFTSCRRLKLRANLIQMVAIPSSWQFLYHVYGSLVLPHSFSCACILTPCSLRRDSAHVLGHASFSLALFSVAKCLLLPRFCSLSTIFALEVRALYFSYRHPAALQSTVQLSCRGDSPMGWVLCDGISLPPQLPFLLSLEIACEIKLSIPLPQGSSAVNCRPTGLEFRS